MIRFNVPPFTGKEYEYIKQAVDNQKICGDGKYTDLDNNGKSELMIGYEHNDLDGNPVVEVYGFVALDDEGNYNILASSWERQRTAYIGNGNFIMDGSGGGIIQVGEEHGI